MNIYKLTDFGDQEIIIGSRADYSRKSHMRLVKKDWLDFVKGYDNSKIFQKDYGFDEKAFLEKYGLRAVQFGNWMDYSDRADHFIALVESLNHLEKIMGIQSVGRAEGKARTGDRPERQHRRKHRASSSFHTPAQWQPH